MKLKQASLFVAGAVRGEASLFVAGAMESWAERETVHFSIQNARGRIMLRSAVHCK